MKKAKCFLIASALIGALGFSVKAATVLKLSNEELAKISDRIVHGKVVSVKYQFSEDKQKIYTLTKLKVEGFLKGAGEQKEIVIRQIGGKMGELQMVVPGDASFKEGEEVIVFVRESAEEGVHFLIGMKQGKFTVKTTENGKRVVTRDFQGMSLAKFTKEGTPMLYKPELEPEPISFEDFLKEIKGYLREKKTEK